MSTVFVGQQKKPLGVSLGASSRLDVEPTGTLREGLELHQRSIRVLRHWPLDPGGKERAVAPDA
jgi:hypothetical protein